MKKYKYPNLSYGYIGISFQNATINSAYMAMILENLPWLNNTINFPQRIPKVGYFSELCILELGFEERFNLTKKKILTELSNTLTNNNFSNKQGRKLVNLCRLMLRFSLFEDPSFRVAN